MKRFALGSALSLLLVACEVAAGAGATCTRASECSAPLTCTYGRCRSECTESRDCPLGVRCIASGGAGVCTLENEERCTDSICAAPLRCVDRQCRTECSVPADCRTGTCERGSCVELVSGTDAAMPDAFVEDASPEDSGSQGDAFVAPDAGAPVCDLLSGEGHVALLEAILGPGPAGLRVLPVGRTEPFTSPQDGGGFVQGQIAIAAAPNADFGHAWIAYLEGTESVLHLVRFDLGDPSNLVPLYPFAGAKAIDHVASFALSTDGDRIRGVAARIAPPSASDRSAWVFEQGPDEPIIHPMTSMSTPPRAQPGRVTIVGGTSPFASAAGPSVFFVFREHDYEGGRGELLAHVGLGLDLGSLADIETTPILPDGFVETDASHGNLVIAYDAIGGRVQAWDQRALLDDAFVELVADATGVPAIATERGDAIASLLAYPRGGQIALRGIDCPAGGSMPCAASAVRVGAMASTSGHVRRVDLSAVTGGYAIAALEAVAETGPGVSIPIRHVRDDLSDVWDCDSGVPCLADVFPADELASGEAVVDMRLSTTPSENGVGIVLAVLIRDAAMGRDRVWVSGFYACRP